MGHIVYTSAQIFIRSWYGVVRYTHLEGGSSVTQARLSVSTITGAIEEGRGSASPSITARTVACGQ